MNKYILIILAAIAIVYLPLLKAEFINLDDPMYTTGNPYTQELSLKNVKAAFFHRPIQVYAPLVTISFAIDKALFNFNALGFHLVNLAFHLGIVFMIYQLCLLLRFKPEVAVLAAFLFGIHPMHVESVAWVTERKDMLYATFYLGAMYAYILHLGGTRFFYCISLFLGGLAILSKPMALTLPLILTLIGWFLGYGIKWKDKIPYCAAMWPVALITFLHENRTPGAELWPWVWSFTFYLKKFFWPVNLTPVSYWAEPFSVLTVIAFVAILASMFLARRNRLIIFAFLFWLLSIFILLRRDFGDYCIVSDRYMYLPSLGICIAVAHYIVRWWSRPVAIGTVIAIALLVAQTSNMVRLWHNQKTFWGYVVVHNPDSEAGHKYLGIQAVEAGDYYKAAAELSLSLGIRPTDVAFYYRAIVRDRLGDNDGALMDITLIQEPTPLMLSWKGYFLLKNHQYLRAINTFNKMLAAEKTEGDYFNVGMAYKNLNDYPRARRAFEMAKLLSKDKALLENNQYNIDFIDTMQRMRYQKGLLLAWRAGR